MPRTTSKQALNASSPVLTTKLDPALNRALNRAVKKIDSDRSKLVRVALRKHLASLGISI